MSNSILRIALVAGLTLVSLVAGRATTYADVNRTPLAVPLTGTQGLASTYPSSITIDARGGPNQMGGVTVTLFAVTHPCPKDLVVVLVHGNDKFLLMNNVGGCRPLQGATIQFAEAGEMIPAFPQGTDPFPELLFVTASFSGNQPVPPAPFPAGGITSGFPPAQTTNVNGKWDLYVYDQLDGNRGVIAGGWALGYNTEMTASGAPINVRIPVNQPAGASQGAASAFPVTYDFSQVKPGVKVRDISIDLTYQHQSPLDINAVLEAPDGTAIVLMALVGGNIAMPAPVTVTLSDRANRLLPQALFVSGDYLPTDARNDRSEVAVPAPGSPGPYVTSFEKFKDKDIRGVWKLYIYDSQFLHVGTLFSSTLRIRSEAPVNLTVTKPQATSTSTQPFVHVEGSLPENVPVADLQMVWRVTNGAGAAFYDAGVATLDAATRGFSAEVPVKKGANRVALYAKGNIYGNGASRDVNVAEFTYSLAEGATGGFFDLDVTAANPAGTDAPISIDYLPESSAPLTRTDTVKANSPLQIQVDAIVPGGGVSTIVHSTQAVPLAVERTMSWDTRGYGGHGGSSADPSTRWLFAEGSQGFFHTYVLLANDNNAAVEATVTFLIEGGGTWLETVVIPAHARRTLDAATVKAVVNKSFGMIVDATAPIIAERAMYFTMTGGNTFDGGHESAGVNAPSKLWFLAEGATGPFFDCFILLSNPGDVPAHATLTYLLPDGTTIPQTLTIAPKSRETVNVEGVDARLGNAAVSTTVTADVAIVAERAMYWPNIAEGWKEAHNSFGVTETGLRWGLADGRTGGARAYSTFVLLANPNPRVAEVQVNFLKAGATTPIVRTYLLPPTSRRTIPVGDEVPELGAGVFGAEIQVLNFQPIAVEKAMYWNSEGQVFAAGTNVTGTRMPPR
jgi:subtilisin-like proprotein convertase family protein